MLLCCPPDVPPIDSELNVIVFVPDAVLLEDAEALGGGGMLNAPQFCVCTGGLVMRTCPFRIVGWALEAVFADGGGGIDHDDEEEVVAGCGRVCGCKTALLVEKVDFLAAAVQSILLDEVVVD